MKSSLPVTYEPRKPPRDFQFTVQLDCIEVLSKKRQHFGNAFAEAVN